MVLSIVIVNYRGWNHLEQCLDSLLFIEGKEKKWEITVVDNDSNDGLFSNFKNRYPWVRFVLNSNNNGFSSGCNLGASHSNGEYILFLNPDVIANKSAIEGILKLLKTNTDLMLVSCRQQNNKGQEKHPFNLFPGWFTFSGTSRGLYKMWYREKLKNRMHLAQDITYPDWVSGSILMMRKSDFQRISGWSEDFWMYYEDVDLCRRVYNTGGKIALTNQYSMEHNHGGTTRVNVATSALTKAEVQISKHVYVTRHFSGIQAGLFHIQCIFNALFCKFLLAALSIPFFFIPKLRIYRQMYGYVVGYYMHTIRNRTWLSPRSPNFGRA